MFKDIFPYKLNGEFSPKNLETLCFFGGPSHLGFNGAPLISRNSSASTVGLGEMFRGKLRFLNPPKKCWMEDENNVLLKGTIETISMLVFHSFSVVYIPLKIVDNMM